MTDPLDIAQWAKNWEALSRQAGEGFASQSPQYPWQTAAPSRPAWMDMFGSSNPFAGAGKQNQAVEHMLAGAQGYLGMLQGMAMAAAGQGAANNGGFAEALRQGGFQGAFSGAQMHNPLASAMRGFAGQGAQGLDQMMERFTAVAGPLFDAAKGSLNMPAFGHLREKQENLQNAARLMIDYQEQTARYDRLMLKVSEQSFARFQLKLAEREEPGRQVDSIRGLYDLWIDAAEEAYAEIALSEEFREVYAAVVDAQMRLRKHVQGEVEKFCSQFGIPTRSEVDSIGQRLQALRREFRERSEGAAGSDDLAVELDSLRRDLAALKKSDKVSAVKPVAAKPANAATASRETKPVVAAKPAKLSKARKPAKVATPAKAAKEKKAAKSARPAKTGKSTTAPVAARPEKAAHATGPTKLVSGSRKNKRKAIKKDLTARRAKRRKSSSGKAAKSLEKMRNTQPGSFAASIARFAQKSKASSTSRMRTRGKTKAATRGGSK